MKLHAIIVPVEEEKFADIEQAVDTTTAKSIIRNMKSSQELEAENEIKIRIVKFVSILFISIFASPFIICDLIFGYSDESCVDTYPENLNLVNMKTYLLVSAYYIIGFLTILFINLCFISENNDTSVILFSLLSIMKNLSQVFLLLWNIIGAIIFWGTLNQRELCSKSTNTYLFVSLIIKLLVNFYNIFNNNKKK
jgi:uncharacterized membrane protein